MNGHNILVDLIFIIVFPAILSAVTMLTVHMLFFVCGGGCCARWCDRSFPRQRRIFEEFWQIENAAFADEGGSVRAPPKFTLPKEKRRQMYENVLSCSTFVATATKKCDEAKLLKDKLDVDRLARNGDHNSNQMCDVESGEILEHTSETQDIVIDISVHKATCIEKHKTPPQDENETATTDKTEPATADSTDPATADSTDPATADSTATVEQSVTDNVDSLPTLEIHREQQMSCSICLAEYEQDEPVVCSKYCSHEFHKECLLVWLENNDVCPCCRQSMMTPQEMKVACKRMMPPWYNGKRLKEYFWPS